MRMIHEVPGGKIAILKAPHPHARGRFKLLIDEASVLLIMHCGILGTLQTGPNSFFIPCIKICFNGILRKDEIDDKIKNLFLLLTLGTETYIYFYFLIQSS